MIQKSILTLIVVLFLLPQIWAANKVYFFNGKVEVIEQGKPARLITNINEPIAETALLKLYNDAEIILRNAEGQFAVFKKNGDFSAEQVKEQFKVQQGKGLVASLAGFMGSQLAHKHEDIRKMSESYMKQKGGVTRSGNTFPLMVWPPYGSVYDTNHVQFTWNSVPGVKKYEFVIFGSEDPNSPIQLSKTLETDTFMDIDFSDFGKDKDAFFSWVAYPEGDPNYSRYTFKIATKDNVQKAEEFVTALASKEKDPESKLLMKAIGYEKAGLVGRAENVYADLLKKYNNSVNQQLYSLFKIRNNILSGL